jgi:Carbohydrate esterase, sialic acid-specific acetylesterase
LRQFGLGAVRAPLISLALLLLFASSASAQNYDIIVSFGQSNATQVGTGPYRDPLQSDAVDRRIVQFGRFGNHAFEIIPAVKTFGGVTVECAEYVNATPCTADTDTHGFIISFARAYVVNVLEPGRKVVILSAGLHETSILEWNGKLILPSHPQGPLLYSDMAGKLRYLLSIPGNRLVSLNWSQGEQDVVYSENSHQYGMRPAIYRDELRSFFQKLRDDFPDVPLLAIKFAPAWEPTSPTKSAIERIIASVVAEYGGKAVSTNGLTPNAVKVPVHFSAQSMQKIGARSFAIWQTLSH